MAYPPQGQQSCSQDNALVSKMKALPPRQRLHLEDNTLGLWTMPPPCRRYLQPQGNALISTMKTLSQRQQPQAQNGTLNSKVMVLCRQWQALQSTMASSQGQRLRAQNRTSSLKPMTLPSSWRAPLHNDNLVTKTMAPGLRLSPRLESDNSDLKTTSSTWRQYCQPRGDPATLKTMPLPQGQCWPQRQRLCLKDNVSYLETTPWALR
jgi:hypothetical protein